MSKECVHKIKSSDGTIYTCKRDKIDNSEYCYLHDINMNIEEKIKILKEDFHAGFSGADLTGAYLKEADLSGVNFEKANLEKVNFEKAILRGALFVGANLKRAVLIEADLKGAFLSDADLENADFTEADLKGAFLKGANLENTDFTGADLKSAFLLEANLTGANLTEANLMEANLMEANLTEANLIGANLKEADLTGADLTGAFIEGFKIYNTNLINVIWAGKKANTKGMDLSQIKCGLHELVQIKNYYQEMGNFKLADTFYVEQIERIQRLIPKSERTLLGKTGYSLWKLSSNYGVSLFRWQALFFSMATFFGFLYWEFELIKYSNPSLESVKGFSHFYFSFITITTLGFGDIIAKKGVGEFVVTLEVLIGYMMLGGLMGIFTKKFIRN